MKPEGERLGGGVVLMDAVDGYECIYKIWSFI
jgi:hypothetical protein